MRVGLARAAALAYGFTCVLLVWWGAPAATAGEPHSIAWRSSLEQARAEARTQNRLIWIQFTGSWCHFCRRMERDTFPKPEIVAQTRDKFIPLMIRADHREDLTAQFGVSGLPATVVVGPSGDILGKHEGFLEPAELLAFLEQYQPRAGATAELALAGNCPVTLVQRGVLKQGQAQLVSQHDGRIYRFADARKRELFLKDPERFVPSNAGRCVVSQLDSRAAIAGNPRFGVYYRERLFLCATEEARQKFVKDPERFAYVDVAEDGYCPHCLNVAGRQVRGVPKYAATHSGRRYFFPDSVHLEAFRASPDKFIR